MNVLLTCAGRRNYLLNYFREVAGVDRVFASDVSPHAPALSDADMAFVAPPVSHPDYIRWTISLCRSHDVRLLVSLNDLELPVLAKNKGRFAGEGILAVVSSEWVVDACFDKWATSRFLEKNGMPSPKTFIDFNGAVSAIRSGEAAFPLVVKPRWGAASIGIEYVKNLKELEYAYTLAKSRLMETFLMDVSMSDPAHCILIQEKMDGDEYGLDVVNDLNGDFAAVFARKKLAMRSGETDRAVTVDDPSLSSLGKRIGEALGHVGNLDCDVFHDGESWYVLEMNPRFGGGYPFSHAAGVNLPEALVSWAENRTPDPRWMTFQAGVYAAKYDMITVCDPGKHLSKSP